MQRDWRTRHVMVLAGNHELQSAEKALRHVSYQIGVQRIPVRRFVGIEHTAFAGDALGNRDAFRLMVHDEGMRAALDEGMRAALALAKGDHDTAFAGLVLT